MSAYSFRDVKSNDSGYLVEGDGESFVVELPKDLASVLRLSDGDMVSWRLKSKDELVLNLR